MLFQPTWLPWTGGPKPGGAVEGEDVPMNLGSMHLPSGKHTKNY